MDILETILNLPRGNSSLERMEKLCEGFGHPERTFATIHVAGTNGKGSVCTKMAAALQSQGYRVGLYTSPHISSFCERIQVNGKMILEEEIEELFADFGATFFETATLLAFLYFQKQKVDVAVIETGLGGRLDATNVVQPLISAITSIGYDHMETLGSSLEEIAREKAGILKEGTPAVIGPNVPYALLAEVAKKKKAPLYRSFFRSSDYDRENGEIASLALQLLRNHFPISDQALTEGLMAKPPCRFERHFCGKEVIFDVAHNSSGFARLLEMLRSFYPNRSCHFLVGFSKGKDIAECARLIRTKASAIHLVSSSHPQLASVEELKKIFSWREIPVYSEFSIGDGVEHALSIPSKDPLVITGSFFIMDEAKKRIAKENCLLLLSAF